MARAAFQVLVFPYLRMESGLYYAVFHRADGDVWQGISGGGEDAETPLEAAQREVSEEAGIKPSSVWLPLKSKVMLPVEKVAGYLWGPHVHFIPEYTFGVAVKRKSLTLSEEHTVYRWCDFETALSLLTYESNRLALRELQGRLKPAPYSLD